jgi:argininosuccinate synthase
MPVIAPWREWSIQSRDEEIDYAEAHNVPLRISRETNYSKDKNLWHLSHEGLDLENTGNEPQYEKPGFLEMGVSPVDAPDVPTYVEIDFEKGVPTAVDGVSMTPKEVILRLNELAKKYKSGMPLTEAELQERDALRKEYVAAFRESLKAQLDNTYIETPDGRRTKLTQRSK